jgi:hypothetical protein
MRSLDRPSFILTNPLNNIHHQQQQLAANNYYTQIYQFYRQSSNNSKNKDWKAKFVQTLSTTTPNYKIDNRIFYRTSFIEHKQKFLTVTKQQQKSIENLSNTEDDINGSLVTSISSNRQSRSNTISNI